MNEIDEDIRKKKLRNFFFKNLCWTLTVYLMYIFIYVIYI
jgi:hypothetical protein